MAMREPETRARALNRLEPESRSTIVMIGDRKYDIEAAEFNGIRSIGVTWGFGSRQELEDAGAHYVVDNPNEVSRLVV